VTALSYEAGKDVVIAADGGRTYRLEAWQCDILLDGFDACKMAADYNRLHEAYVAVWGIPRVSSLRAA
jgi:hypothetical protein